MQSIGKFLLVMIFFMMCAYCDTPQKELDPSVLEYLISNGITVIPVEGKGQKLKVNLSRQKDLSDSKIGKLSKIKTQLVDLDLSDSNFSNSMAKALAIFPNLESLDISNTEITEEGINNLSNLSKLKMLNVANTKIGADRIAKLIDEIPGLEVDQGDSDNSISKLSAPNIDAKKEIFNDKIEVKILSSIKGAKIYYTLDGTEPNEQSPLYDNPLDLSKTTIVKAVAVKVPGQLGSIASKKFIQTKVKIKNVSLDSAPSEKYKASGASSLVDHLRGGSNFSTQFWIGYQGEHLTANFEFDEMYPISQVNISALSDANNWIHFPKGIKVWFGDNPNDMKLHKEIEFDEIDGSDPNEAKYFSISFDEIQTRHLKVQALSQMKNPNWHPSKGEPCWIFVDELIVE